MKLKGVNAFEQHVEKIVLIAVSAVFLIVLAMQFLLEPNRVKVLGAKDAVPPGKAFLAVETKAKELQALMTAPADSVLPQVQKIDLVNQLQSRRTTSLTGGGKALVLGPAPVIEGAKSGVQVTGADRIQPLEVPAPAKVLAMNHSNTFSPTEPVTNPALKPLLPQEQPLDKHSVTIAGSFDGTALKDSLSKGEGAVKPIPSNWYRDALELVAVKVERQEQKPDGSWGDAVVIDPPPGRLTLAEALKGVHGSADLADVVAEAASSADDLLRPDFYSTIAGEPFKAPMDLTAPTAAAAAAPKEVQDLIRERKEKVASAERLKKSKADLEKEQPRNAAPRGGGGGGGGKGAGGGGGGGGGDGGAREAERQQKERQARLDNFDKLIKQAEDRIAAIDTKLTELGFDTDGRPGAPAAANPAGQPNTLAAAKPLLENADVRVWTHDLTVAPGKTYRYRMMVAVNNPAFARTSALVKEQQDLAGSPLVYSAASQWSEPIQVMADQYYFVTSAQEADNLGPARATTEVFRFFYGYYRRGAVNLEPGDSIATTIKLPDPNKLPIYDMTALKDGVLPPAPGVPAPAVAPQPPRDGGGGKGGGGGGGKGGNLAPQQEERPAAQPGQEPGKVALPPNSKPYGKPTVSAAFDLILLDVAKTLGYTGEARSQAYFRGDQGKIVVAVPDEERKLAVWNAVVQSAKDGETQGVQAPTDTKDPNKAPTVKPPKEKTPKPSPGGGGGGGAN